jgi:hypothetical protein
MLIGITLSSLTLAAVLAQEPIAVGGPLTQVNSVSIGELLGNPEAYVGKTVQVRGAITDVCPKAGCWVDIEDADNRIRFKVNDGEIVFPLEAKGRRIVAEGVLTRIEMTREQAVGYARHLAEEKNEPFDPKSVTGPMKIYQIQGSGAVMR